MIYYKQYLCNVDLINHGHGTRNNNLPFVLPHVKTQGSKSFIFNAIKLWNNLPSHVKQINDKVDFKSKCKLYMMKKMRDVELSDYTV